jgi:hypothetical protein
MVDTAAAATAGDSAVNAAAPTNAPHRHRRTRWVWAVVVVALAVVGGVTVAALASSNSHPASAVAVGRTLQPLSIYQRVAVTTTTDPHPHVAAGQRVVPDLGRAGTSSVIDDRRAISLHAQYAVVRAVRGRWQVQLFAPEGRTFNAANGRFFVALYQGQATDLFVVRGSGDGTNFAFQTGLDRAGTVAFAKALTTRVVVSG